MGQKTLSALIGIQSAACERSRAIATLRLATMTTQSLKLFFTALATLGSLAGDSS